MAIVGSSALHSIALAVALLGAVWNATTPGLSPPTTIDARVSKWRSESVASLAEGTAVRVAPLEDEANLSEPSLDDLERPIANESLRQLARARLEAETKRAEALDPEQQFQKLQAASNRLSQLSSDKSVSEISDQLRKVLDLPQRATEPVADTAETDQFDSESAQLSDVLKEVSDDGNVRYVAVLLDAQGRTSKYPLSEDEGKKLHRIMQLIKSNPLLERVYRELAMPLLDQLLKKPRTDQPLPPKSPME